MEDVAEEKAANFDTLIKDIRKGTDYVVVLLWGWRRHADEARAVRHPFVEQIYVMDAYQLAQMRDCRWLNSPPADVAPGRQGFDLCFGVNCKAGKYNQEEGNYGKLMRVFEPSMEEHLPADVQKGTTLRTYYEFQKHTIQTGLEVIGERVARAFYEGAEGSHKLLSRGAAALPVIYLAERGPKKLLIVGGAEMLRKGERKSLLEGHQVTSGIFLNAKFQCKACRADGNPTREGKKPRGAELWAVQL